MSNDVKVLAVFSTIAACVPCVTCVTCVTCKFHFCCLDSCLGQLTRRSKNGDSEATKPRSLPRWGRPNVPGTACGMGLPGAEICAVRICCCWNLLEFGRKAKAKVMAPYKKPFLRCDFELLSTETSLWEHFSGNDEANVLRQWKSVLLQSRQHPIQPTRTKELKGWWTSVFRCHVLVLWHHWSLPCWQDNFDRQGLHVFVSAKWCVAVSLSVASHKSNSEAFHDISFSHFFRNDQNLGTKEFLPNVVCLWSFWWRKIWSLGWTGKSVFGDVGSHKSRRIVPGRIVFAWDLGVIATVVGV